MKTKIVSFLSALYLVLGLSGCSSFVSENLEAQGAKASAFCTTGGPGGTLGIGPGGIVAGAKVNEDFKGTVAVARDCSIGINAR